MDNKFINNNFTVCTDDTDYIGNDMDDMGIDIDDTDDIEDIADIAEKIRADKSERFVKALGELVMIYEEKYKKMDFRIDREQLRKSIEVYNFIKKITGRGRGGEIEKDFTPWHISFGLTAKADILDFFGDDLAEFSRIAGYCSAISIDALADGRVCFSCTVPNVFIPVPRDSADEVSDGATDNEEN